jgi:hypothetical protein
MYHITPSSYEKKRAVHEIADKERKVGWRGGGRGMKLDKQYSSRLPQGRKGSISLIAEFPQVMCQ